LTLDQENDDLVDVVGSLIRRQVEVSAFCALVALFPLLPSSAEAAALEKRVYALRNEVVGQIRFCFEQATEDTRRQGKKMDRGPVRYFLEKNGVDFPYGASATLDDGRIELVNTRENLDRTSQLFESLSPAVSEKVETVPVRELEIPLFDPNSMDYERLAHKESVYTNVIVTGSTPAELEILHTAGSATLPLAELNPAVQSRFSYEPEKAQIFLDSNRRKVEEEFEDSSSKKSGTEQNPMETKALAGQESMRRVSEDFPPRQETVNPAQNLHHYGKIICRDGRVFENVEVRADHMGFTVRKQAVTGKTEERVSFWDAPSSLLLDFEEFDELFRRFVVANRRTQLYELTRDGIKGGKPFQDLAKDPSVGISFVSVPEGYVFSNMNWISLPAPAVEFVVPLGSRTFAVADASNLVGLSPSEWWNKWAGHGASSLPVPGRLQRREPGKNSVLYSPFSPDSPILGNSAGEVKRLWVDAGSDKNGHLALVETGNGLFYGYYREHAALENSELTWADATRQNSGRFALAKINTEKVQPGGRVLKLFNASAKKVLGSEFKELRQLKLGGQHFKALLEKGIEAAVQDRVLPKGDGVQFPEGGVETESSLALDKVVITDQVDAKLKDVLPHAYVFDVESKQRVIEIRKENSGSGTKFQESRPQRRKQNEVVEVPPDLDGGLRLTDAKRVYELKPAFGGTELVVWEAERNKLKR
jgi:hypothetical protein